MWHRCNPVHQVRWTGWYDGFCRKVTHRSARILALLERLPPTFYSGDRAGTCDLLWRSKLPSSHRRPCRGCQLRRSAEPTPEPVIWNRFVGIPLRRNKAYLGWKRGLSHKAEWIQTNRAHPYKNLPLNYLCLLVFDTWYIVTSRSAERRISGWRDRRGEIRPPPGLLLGAATTYPPAFLQIHQF